MIEDDQLMILRRATVVLGLGLEDARRAHERARSALAKYTCPHEVGDILVCPHSGHKWTRCEVESILTRNLEPYFALRVYPLSDTGQRYKLPVRIFDDENWTPELP